MNNQFQIRVHSGALRGQAFVINKQEFKVGRDPSCDIVLNENAVSRVHLLIYPQAYNALVLVDNNSTNGTTVNNVQVTAPVQIAENDVIMLGGEVALAVEKIPTMQSQYPAQPGYPQQPVQGYPQQGYAQQGYPPMNPEAYAMSGYPQQPAVPQPPYGYQNPVAPAAPEQSFVPQQPYQESTPTVMSMEAAQSMPEPISAAPAAEIPPMEAQQQPMQHPAMPQGYPTPNAPYSGYPVQAPVSQFPPQQPYAQMPYGQQPYPPSQFPGQPHFDPAMPAQGGMSAQGQPYPQQQFQGQQLYGQQQAGYPPYDPYQQQQQYYGGAQQPYGAYPYGNPEYQQEEPVDLEAKKKKKLFIILGIVLALILAIIIFIIYIDTNYLWCDAFPFLWSADACAGYPHP